jgi:hypothetical protein
MFDDHEIKAINIELATLTAVHKQHAAWAEHYRDRWRTARAAGHMNDAEDALRGWGRHLGRMDEIRARIADLRSKRRQIAGV